MCQNDLQSLRHCRYISYHWFNYSNNNGSNHYFILFFIPIAAIQKQKMVPNWSLEVLALTVSLESALIFVLPFLLFWNGDNILLWLFCRLPGGQIWTTDFEVKWRTWLQQLEEETGVISDPPSTVLSISSMFSIRDLANYSLQVKYCLVLFVCLFVLVLWADIVFLDS